MKFLAAASLGYFTLSGVAAIEGMHPAYGGPIPDRYCGDLESQLTIGDFPVDSHPGRYFVRYNRQNKERYRAFVKCAPFDQTVVTLADAKARKTYVQMFVRKYRMGLYLCLQSLGEGQQWAQQWAIPDCPAREHNQWDAFFPEDAQLRIPQTLTEIEDPYLGAGDCPSDNHYWFDGAWVESPCDSFQFAHMGNGACKDLYQEDLFWTKSEANEISFDDNNRSNIKGIGCGFSFQDIELAAEGKVIEVIFQNSNAFQWLPANVFDNLRHLNTFNMEDQTQFTTWEPSLFAGISRPKQMDYLTITGQDADVMHQWGHGFFGPRDWFGAMEVFGLSDMSALSSVKPGWMDAMKSISELDMSDNAALESIPANVFDKFDSSYVDLSGNNLSEVPVSSFGEMKRLIDMDLSDNSFTELPNSLFEDIDPIAENWSINIEGNACTPVENPCEAANTCACA